MERMRKKEKKSDLEGLLNSLIKKGWKPFGYQAKEYRISIFNIRNITLQLYHNTEPKQEWLNYNIRSIVSLESGLWQFVCENGMIDNLCETRYWRNHFELDEIEYNQPDYQYWVIESSLKDESELEDFLLSNINVKG